MMSTKTRKGILLMILGGIGGTIALFAYQSWGLRGDYTMLALGMATSGVLIGSILVFSRALASLVKPSLDGLRVDIEDDIQDIQQRRFTTTQFMVITFVAVSCLFAYYVLRYHKIGATWGNVPVIAPTFIIVSIVAWIVVHTEWFEDQRLRTPIHVFLIPVAGLFLSLYLGIGINENAHYLRVNRDELMEYSSDLSTDITWLYIVEDVTTNIPTPYCSDDVCAALFLVIALIVITFILVAGSAFIPHFWLLSGFVFEAILALMTIHEIRVRRS
jgi:hypothetical protein